MALINNQHEANEIKNALARDLEGKLFATIEVSKSFGTHYNISKDHYTVIDGIVYSVDDGRKRATDDDIFNLKAECRQIGIYDPKKKYVRTVKEYTYGQLLKKLGL